MKKNWKLVWKPKKTLQKNKMKKKFLALPALILSLFVSCKNGSKLEGRWTSVTTGAIYEFTKTDFTLSTTILNSSIMVRGIYKLSGQNLRTVARSISFDFGETWEDNDGSLIPTTETCSKIVIEKDKIILSDVEYVKF